MKTIIILIAFIASCIWAFDVKNLSDCTESERKIDIHWEEFTIKCQKPVEYEIEIDIMWHELYGFSEDIYTENGKKTDAVYFDPDGDAHHEISEQDEYGVYVSMNNQIISTNMANKLLMKKWKYFKKLKKQIETNEYVPEGGWYGDNNGDCPSSWQDSDGNCKEGWNNEETVYKSENKVENTEPKDPYTEYRIAQIMEKYK